MCIRDRLSADHKLLVTMEENVRSGGYGEKVMDYVVEQEMCIRDRHRDMISYIKGIHLQQSLTGDYVKQWLQEPHEMPEDPAEQFCWIYEHIFQIDKHEPFTATGVRELVERIDPLYVTYEYITRSREELRCV